MNTIRKEELGLLFEAVAGTMRVHADELCAMDAKMGDGDLGLTMKKGFSALPELLKTIEEPDIGEKMMLAGMKMSSVAPSTMGTLMASGLMSGGKALAGLEQIDAEAFVAFLEGFSEGIAKRGKCQRGDRTVLDSVAAATDEARARAESGGTLIEIAQAALCGAKKGTEATKTMMPKFGKAAIFSQRALGTPDQGACAGMYFIEGLLNYIENAQ